ncbi:cyclase family protein [Saccharothrix australiensis]|uniref:Putative cyclase n=1 Tax=Saccharothrix australiensis TaxID=2072 RepID=A0A495VZ18_9PSEU|nr:cyclase family protein [Saccharothrix australiensis]RKT53763.1 putative cyclase [Saccharothrix australiensis]
MNPDLLRNYLVRHHVGRRDVLRMAGAAGAAGLVGAASSAPASATTGPAEADATRLDDTPFDYADPANLSDWAPSRYGPDDQRGTLNEVTPAKTAAALALLRPRRDVTTYNLGELMWNGFPAFRTEPRRTYEQRLTVLGYQPPPGFREQGGILVTPEPLGDNRISIHEERFEAELSAAHPRPVATTFQIGSQLDNLNHIGAAEFFYNGLRGPDIARGHGTVRLGAENVGPVVTRGVLLDVLGVKLAGDRREDLAEPAANGRPLLRENYRITVEDIRDAMEFGGIDRLEPGDAILFRTGWSNLLARRDPADIARWEGARGLPGIYLREARWLARARPAVIGGDTWALEVVGNPVNDAAVVFPAHQELIMRHGIRIGESYVVDRLAADRVHEFVFIVTPQYSQGATAGNTPPAALGQPRRR